MLVFCGFVLLRKNVMTFNLTDNRQAMQHTVLMMGYILTKSGFPTAPMLLSFVLAKLLESNMSKAFISSGGSLDIFFTRPITCVLMLIFMAFIFTPVIKAVWKKSRSAKA